MSYPISEAHRNLREGQLPDFAQPEAKTGGLFGLFAKKTAPADVFGDLLKAMPAPQLDHYAKQLLPVLKALHQQPVPAYAMPGAELRAFLEKFKHQLPNGYYLANLASPLMQQDWLKGEHYQQLRVLFFLMGYTKVQPDDRLLPIIHFLPEHYRTELFLLLVMGNLKQGRLATALPYLLRMSKLNDSFLGLFVENRDWFYSLAEQETGEGYGGRLFELMQFMMEINQAAHDETKKGLAQSRDLSGTPVWEKMEALPEPDKADVLRLMSTLLVSEAWFFHSQRAVTSFMMEWSAKIAPSEPAIIAYLSTYVKNGMASNLPSGLLTSLNKLLAQGAVSDKLYETLWDFYFSTRTRHLDFPEVYQFLRQESRRRMGHSPMPTWEVLMTSGFHPVQQPYPHNPYHGLHPDQVRPYLRLLREVADVVLVKFYRVEKLHHLKIVVNDVHFDLKTGDTFGHTPHQDFNNLLFQQGIPYQFVTLNPSFFAFNTHPGDAFSMGQVVVLVNEETYRVYQQRLAGQRVIGFAKTARPAPPVLKHLSELPELHARPEFDNLDIETDPKFAVLQDQFEKLKPLSDWSAILGHAMKFPQDGKPGKTWVKEADSLIGRLPADNFRSGLVLVLDTLAKGDDWFVDDEKLCGLRGLTWLCRCQADASLLFALQKMATKAYKKVPGGPLNAKLGNIALESLANIGTAQAFGVLGNLKAKAKYPVFQRAIAASMKKFTKLLDGISPDELQDQVVPDHELVAGKKTLELGSYQAHFRLNGLRVEVAWENEKGKVTASAPAELRRDCPADVKAVSASAKSIEETLSAQAHRLEDCWLQQRSWRFENWDKYFAQHPLMGVLVERLVWQADFDGSTSSFTCRGGSPVDVQGSPVPIPADATIRLWHPAVADVPEVMAWRNWLFANQVVQPFKQAFREVYVLTPAEEATHDHSLRFAGHHLAGNTLYSLGKTRQWTMSYDMAPLRKIPNHALTAVLNINGGVLYSNCTTMDLHFLKTDPNAKQSYHWNGTKLPLSDVPPVVLSEVMRDVDLFVAIANIGIDPHFDQKNTGDLLDYWREVSFGNRSKTSIAEIRRDLIARLLPMTKIANQCRLGDDNWLYVKGKKGSYKINLGSGNILMEPGDRYLCIVSGAAKAPSKQIWLPFEGGDQVLMVILSKAFLLAADDKITDPTILRQLG